MTRNQGQGCRVLIAPDVSSLSDSQQQSQREIDTHMDTERYINTYLYFSICKNQILSFLTTSLIPIQKHREHSRLFLFDNGTPFSSSEKHWLPFFSRYLLIFLRSRIDSK